MYRKGNESGGFKKSDCNEEDLHAFKELVHILKPTVIICLGRITFELVLKSFDLPRSKGKFRKIVEDNRNPSIIYHTENKNIAIFPVYHAGSFGVLNRNRGTQNTGLELMEEDWLSIKEYLDNN